MGYAEKPGKKQGENRPKAGPEQAKNRGGNAAGNGRTRFRRAGDRGIDSLSPALRPGPTPAPRVAVPRGAAFELEGIVTRSLPHVKNEFGTQGRKAAKSAPQREADPPKEGLSTDASGNRGRKAAARKSRMRFLPCPKDRRRLACPASGGETVPGGRRSEIRWEASGGSVSVPRRRGNDPKRRIAPADGMKPGVLDQLAEKGVLCRQCPPQAAARRLRIPSTGKSA